ncbi:MAG: uncharacterized protein JWO38_2924 [Gemmataceae bacterium]|nr:uncharacterized protein [Gemmataceae bacterium]
MPTPQKFMEMAIELAAACTPKDPRQIPKVGAVIDLGGMHFVGQRGENDHAEKNAITAVEKAGLKGLLAGATVYTTLEPCTKHVRRKPRESCTERLIAEKVKKVVIGILDPNQGVCGKGVLELQEHDIEVELFPHDLADKIRGMNAEFVRAQQDLGLTFVSPKPGDTFPLLPQAGGGWYSQIKIVCECVKDPGGDIRVLNSQGGRRWPQATPLREIAGTDQWEAEVGLGSEGSHTIHVVRASDLGAALIAYYHKVVDVNRKRSGLLKGKIDAAIQPQLPGDWPGIDMPSLPKGLDSQGHVTVNLVKQVAGAK